MNNNRVLFFTVIMAVFVLSMLPVNVVADEEGAYCINDSTRFFEDEIYEVTPSGAVELTIINKTTPCYYGCAYGHCIPNFPNYGLLPVVVLLGILSFVFAYTGLNMIENDRVLFYLFFPMSIFMGVIGLFIVIESKTITPGINNVLSSSMYGIIIIFVVMMVVFALMFISKLMEKNLPYGPRPSDASHDY